MFECKPTLIHRRESLFLLGMGGLLASTYKSLASTLTPHPILWRVERNGAKAYIFGFGDAKDRSWLTPAIESAFQESREIWFETPHVDPSVKPSPAPVATPNAFPKYDNAHDLFAVLDPKLSVRLATAAQTYDVPHDALVHARVWWAYFVLNRGYWAWRNKNGLGEVEESPDSVLAQMAWSAAKPTYSEHPTDADTIGWFATLSDEAARERLEELLDYFDDEKAGLHADRFDWIYGHPPDHTIQAMRIKQPALYDVEHVRRNEWWAAQIAKLLANGGTYFVAIGANHVLGPESLLKKLSDLGLQPQAG